MTTKQNKRNLEWGILLISFGIAALLDSFSIGNEWIKTGVIALGGLVGLAVFLLDRSDWVLMIPPYILLIAAGISALALSGRAEGDLFASFVLFVIALPFLVVYLRDRANWWALIPAYVLIAIALLVGLSELSLLNEDLIGPLVLVSIGLPFLVIYLQNRSNWWALIPAYVLFSIGLLIGLEEFSILNSDLIASFILGSISLPFLVIFLIKRSNWWALIPFYVLAALAVMIPLIEAGMLSDGWIATYILSSVALPFLVVYLYKRENWWALIPAYVLLAIGLMIGLITSNVLRDLVIPGYIMLATAAPFLVVFLINRQQRWALITGGIVGLVGVAFLANSSFIEYIGPAVLILLGLWVLLRGIRKQ